MIGRARWKGFQQRFREELSSPEHRARMQELLGAAGEAPLTLVYGAKDPEHNQAVLLRDELLRMSRRG